MSEPKSLTHGGSRGIIHWKRWRCKGGEIKSKQRIHRTPNTTSLPVGVVVRPFPYNDTPLNPTAVEFRPRRDAAVAALQRLQDIVERDT